MSHVNLLIRGGYVLTMDSAGDLPSGDMHIRDGVIQAIGKNLDVPGADLVDASGKIVAPNGRIHLGMAWRGTGGSNPAMRVAPGLYRTEIAAARELGLPVSVHASGPALAAGQLATYAADDLLGPDLQLVHLNNASPAELAMAVAAGTVVADGQVLKRDGKLTAVDLAEITAAARSTLTDVLARSIT